MLQVGMRIPSIHLQIFQTLSIMLNSGKVRTKLSQECIFFRITYPWGGGKDFDDWGRTKIKNWTSKGIFFH